MIIVWSDFHMIDSLGSGCIDTALWMLYLDAN